MSRMRLSPWLVLAIAGCSDSGAAGPEPFIESAHFFLLSREGDATEAELDDAVVVLESLFASLSAAVGTQRTPTERLWVVMEGPRGPNDGNYVDRSGLVHIYRDSPADGGYFSPIAHLLVHAFRHEYTQNVGARSWEGFRLIDEALAEYLATELDPDRSGFALFGYPLDVVAGHWLVTGQSLPLDTLRDRHGELNGLCQYQAYPLRASWMQYIDEEFGRDVMLEFAYPGNEPTRSYMAQVLGVAFSRIEQDWSAWLATRYAAIPGADQLGQMYRGRIGDAYVCRSGVDFALVGSATEPGSGAAPRRFAEIVR